MSASTFIVTGAAGFIGSHLSRARRSEGANVIGIDNCDPFYDKSIKQSNIDATTDMTSGSFVLHEIDIRDSNEITRIVSETKPDAIFHLAALAGVRPSIAEPARYTSVNVDGTMALLEAARSAACENLIVASSSSVYGNNKKVPFAEDDPIEAPISPYAATKRAAELLCGVHAHLFGLRIASLRFFTVYGPGQRPDLAINLFMRKMAAGESITMFGDGSSSRDYTFIDDIIAGVLAARNRICSMPKGTHRIWNLGGSSPITLSELIDAIASVTGCTPNIERKPMQPGDVNQTWADVTRSREELGYEPQTPIMDGLKQQWQWMEQTAAPA